MFLGFMDVFSSTLAGVVIFSLLGYMALKLQVDISAVVQSGTTLLTRGLHYPCTFFPRFLLFACPSITFCFPFTYMLLSVCLHFCYTPLTRCLHLAYPLLKFCSPLLALCFYWVCILIILFLIDSFSDD